MYETHFVVHNWQLIFQVIFSGGTVGWIVTSVVSCGGVRNFIFAEMLLLGHAVTYELAVQRGLDECCRGLVYL
jgi:hypothetical protein